MDILQKFQSYIKLYLSSLNSESSKIAVAKNLCAALKRVDFEGTKDKDSALSFHWHELSINQYSEIKDKLVKDGRSSSYTNTILTILRQTLNWAFIDDKISELKFEKIKKVIKSVSSNKKRQVLADTSDDEIDLDWLSGQVDNLNHLSNETDLGSLPEEIINNLIKSIGVNQNIRKRDRAIFMCMSHAGMRREEVSTLRLQDIFFSRTGYKDSFIKIVGKGAKLRDVPMNQELYKSLIDWSKLIMKTDNKRKTSTVFRKINIVDKILNCGLSNTGIYNVIRKRGEDEGILGLHPHKLRHYFATKLLINGRDIFEVARLLGHSNVETTRHYDNRGFSTLQDAVEEL